VIRIVETVGVIVKDGTIGKDMERQTIKGNLNFKRANY